MINETLLTFKRYYLVKKLTINSERLLKTDINIKTIRDKFLIY